MQQHALRDTIVGDTFQRSWQPEGRIMEIKPGQVCCPSTSRTRTKEVWTDLSKLDGPQGRDDCQFGWQIWVGQSFHHCTILDVGAGLGLSRERLAAGENAVVLQDPALGMPVDIHDDVALLGSRSFDVVTAFDVIEHVAADCIFLTHLCRIARRAVVITTPNYDVSKAANPFHVREYSPPELLALLEGISINRLVAGDSNGTARVLLSAEEFAQHTFPHQAAILDIFESDLIGSADPLGNH